MFAKKYTNFILFLVLTCGVSQNVPNVTKQENPQLRYTNVTTPANNVSSSETTTSSSQQSTSSTYSTPSDSMLDSDRHNVYSNSTTTMNNTNNSKTKLVIAGFYSGKNGSWDGTGMRPSVKLALKHVNENPHILENYELDVHWKDSRCEAADGVWAFHSHLVEEPTKIMILGPPCSPDAEPVAQTSERGNLVTMSYSAASPALSDREKHPYFFRTYKTDVILNPGRIWLFDRFNWTRIGSIHQNIDAFILTHHQLYELLSKGSSTKNVTVEVKEIFDDRPSERQMKTLKDEDIKIILASSYDAPAREIFCQAYGRGLYGKGYMWILLGWYNTDWWRVGDITDCTNEEVETAVEESMYISLESANFSETPETMTVAGYTANEIRRQLEDEAWDEDDNPSGLEMFAYDGLWAIALTLNRTDEILAKDQYKFGRLENFTYNSKDIVAKNLGRLFFQEMNATSFLGASGHVDLRFGDQQGIVNIEQLQPYCEEGWHRFNFSCYKIVNEQRNWTASRQYCKDLAPERRSHLVSILSQKESTFLKNRTKHSTTLSWYIGLTYNISSKRLNWVDTNKNHVRWWPASFKIKEEKSACYVWNFDTGHWGASECETERHFICRKRANFKEQLIVTLFSNKNRATVLKWNTPHYFMWHDDEIPIDRTHPKEDGLQRGAYISLAVCAGLGIILAISLLIFNILTRNHRFVKLSSPNLNNLVLVGCLLIYVSICILGLEVVDPEEKREPVRASCMLRMWFVSVGFVLGFGAIFSKIWRVYRVASIKHGAKKVVIKDSKLFGLVGILLLPDVILLILWTCIDPLQHQSHDIDLDSYVELCECNYFKVWAILLGFYKGLILVIGVFLAWETRNVKIPALNDSKSIGLCIYTTTLLCVIGVATSLPFPYVPAYQHLITSACMLFCTTFILLIVFVPKIWFVYKPPKLDRNSTSTNLYGTVSRIKAHSEPTIDKTGVDGSGNVVSGSLKSFSKFFSNRGKRSFSVEEQTKAVHETTTNGGRKNSVILIGLDNVFM